MCAAEELAVLKTSDSAIYIDAIDGEVLPLGTHSVKIEAGEHKITLSYHKIGGSNYLLVETEAVVFGGYDDYYNIIKGSLVNIQYNEPLRLTLPLNKSEVAEKYNLTWSDSWLMIGSADCYLSK